MACVSKAAFLKPLRQRVEKFSLPEYGDDAYVVIQALTSKDLLALQALHGTTAESSNLDFAHELLCRAMVDDSGNRIFADAAEVRDGIDLSLPALESLVERVMAVSGIKTEKN